jgi:hypothetical protein
VITRTAIVSPVEKKSIQLIVICYSCEYAKVSIKPIPKKQRSFKFAMKPQASVMVAVSIAPLT